MKISKLFHWLYFLLMFLPIFIGGTGCLMYVLSSIRHELPIDLIDTLISCFNDCFDNVLFSWSKTSFLNVPFSYLTNMFGFTNNIITYLFSYWLTISIIWLTFDVVMYVPNLAHRWLDRGAIE